MHLRVLTEAFFMRSMLSPALTTRDGREVQGLLLQMPIICKKVVYKN